ncbi:hypothetical protein C4K31_5095 [Pseudomonas chlororaphis subsp. piscium]|nr:hypothetical protein C4K31_5095 [Pseudomonas chlororaphis subsp. piscium]
MISEWYLIRRQRHVLAASRSVVHFVVAVRLNVSIYDE